MPRAGEIARGARATAPAAEIPTGETPTTEPAPTDRENVAAVLDELSGWGPRDRHSMFQHWHRGALSLVHLNVLAALEAEGPMSMSRLAESLDVSVASATGIVDRMERRCLVERRHATDDRRVVLVDRTPTGSQVFRDLGARRRELLGRLLGELSDDDLTAFLRGVRALRAARARLVAEAHESAGVEVTANGHGPADGSSAEPTSPADPLTTTPDGSPTR